MRDFIENLMYDAVNSSTVRCNSQRWYPKFDFWIRFVSKNTVMNLSSWPTHRTYNTVPLDGGKFFWESVDWFCVIFCGQGTQIYSKNLSVSNLFEATYIFLLEHITESNIGTYVLKDRWWKLRVKTKFFITCGYIVIVIVSKQR